MRFALLITALLAFAAQAGTLEFTLKPTTTDVLGKPLPATGPGALTSHRVEYGTCDGAIFGTPIAQTVVPMPKVSGSFPNVPAGVYCVRAFPSNEFDEGKPYPISAVGPAPSDGGSIVVLKVSP